MPRRPEIGNVKLYPDRPLRDSDKYGYVLKFYCPLQQKRIRRSCGTRDRREARRVMRECQERLINGQYALSGGAITAEFSAETMRLGNRVLALARPKSAGPVPGPPGQGSRLNRL